MPNALCVRIDETVSRSLEKICKQLERPKSYVVKKALESYFNEYAEYQIALDRLNDKNDRIISPSELRNTLGL